MISTYRFVMMHKMLEKVKERMFEVAKELDPNSLTDIKTMEEYEHWRKFKSDELFEIIDEFDQALYFSLEEDTKI